MKVTNIIERLLANGEAGRHKVYASTKHPLLNRLLYAGKDRTDVDAVQWGQMPEAEFWKVVEDKAATENMPEAEALVHLLETPVDFSQSPPHPLAARA